MAPSFFHTSIPSSFGALGMVWQEAEAGPRVYRILLPIERTWVEDIVPGRLKEVRPRSSSAIAKLIERILRFLEGEAVEFDLEMMALEGCSEFQRRVLLANYRIPRGWVSTYGGMAQNLGIPRSGRAVGGALSQNPFPIIIPCHRVLRSDGGLGGFSGGLAMKRSLLQLEGVEFSATGKAITDRIYY